MADEICEFDDFAAPYIEISLSIIIFIILQVWLLKHTIYYECKSFKKHKQIHRTKLSVRISFISLQLCVLYWLIVDLFRFVLDPFFKFVQNNPVSCSWAAYTPKAIVMTYGIVYLHQIYLRVYQSFRGSHLALSNTFLTLLAIFIFFPLITCDIAFFIVLADINKPCIWIWKPMDIAVSNDFAFCDYRNEGLSSMIIGFSVLWVLISNIVVGCIFALKLRHVLRANAGQEVTSFRLKSLIIKNGILTTTATVSTLFNYAIWLFVTPMTGTPLVNQFENNLLIHLNVQGLAYFCCILMRGSIALLLH